MSDRPNPDLLLKHAQADEEALSRGRLKLFFGANPGVGKTYAMLEAAQQRKKEGWDVVIGVVETHGRPDTMALSQGLEVLPRREISYKNIVLQEFDLDSAIQRRPRLLLVDELAHTNAPGVRHAKRWQDVEDILDAGIDVYTTLNVQHWESLNDIVAQITGVVVRETVPDTFLQRTHELELVDLAPEDLLKRLSEGKVYRAATADQAVDNFFKPGNLIALRELALRHAADYVNLQMEAFKERHAIGEVWSAGEKLLVGVTGNPMSPRLVRATSRLAKRLRAPWIAVHVQSSAFLRLKPEEQGRAIEHLRLAEKLGAETITLAGDDAAKELLTFARARNVTRIILGKPARPQWQEWFFGSVVNQLARRCGNIDLNIISGMGSDLSNRRPAVAAQPMDWKGIRWGAITVLICTLICWPLSHAFDRVNLAMIYLTGVVWVAYCFGQRASFFTSVLSVLSFDFFFVPPYFTFAATDTQYFLTFGIMLGVGFLISTITGRLRQQTDLLRKREERMRALYKLSRDLSETPDMQGMLRVAHQQLEQFYRLPILLLINDEKGQLVLSAGDAPGFNWNDNEHSVARWVFEKNQIAGIGSDTLAGASGLYLPLKGIRSTVGVLAIRPADAKTFNHPEQLQLLETFAGEIGGALESTRMSEAIGRTEMQEELKAIHSTHRTHLRMSNVLTLDQILVFKESVSKAQLFRDLLARLPLPNPSQALQAIHEREKAGPTFIGTNLVVPHARIPGLKKIHAALGISQEGPLYLLFVGPVEDPGLHLAFLSSISAFCQHGTDFDALRRMQSPEKILNYIRQIETTS